MLVIENKIVVITGASSGLGEATARLLARQRGAATKHAVRALSKGLRQEVKPYGIRTTVISPGAVATELLNTITDPAVLTRVQGLYDDVAIPAASFARAVAFAMSQPDDVDIDEILFRPTKQEY